MDERLRKFIEEYTDSPEARAILCVRDNFDYVDGYWVDIVRYKENLYREDEFYEIVFGLYSRRYKPEYPKREPDQTRREYYLVCRAITAITAHDDILHQKNNGYKATIMLMRKAKRRNGVTKYYFKKFCE